MKTPSTALTRPRSAFGVASATVVERMFIENMSTKPLTASAANESGNQRESPKTTMLAPNAPTTSSSVRPAWPPSGLRASRIPPTARRPRSRCAARRARTAPCAGSTREERQQRDGAAEEHGEQVERDRAEDDRRRRG